MIKLSKRAVLTFNLHMKVMDVYNILYNNDMNIKDLPRHLRPREKLKEKGTDGLKDKELLAILLRTGSKGKNAIEVAEYILNKHPLKNLSVCTYSDLEKNNGIDSGKITTILAAFELSKRAMQVHSTHLPLIQSPEDAVIQLQSIRQLKKEHFVAFYLDARNQLLLKETISIGSLNSSIVHPREVFEPGIRLTAASILVAHNHPSGDPTPSEQDIKITKQLIEAGNILAIDVIDHIIIAKESFVSMKARGYLE